MVASLGQLHWPLARVLLQHDDLSIPLLPTRDGPEKRGRISSQTTPTRCVPMRPRWHQLRAERPMEIVPRCSPNNLVECKCNYSQLCVAQEGGRTSPKAIQKADSEHMSYPNPHVTCGSLRLAGTQLCHFLQRASVFQEVRPGFTWLCPRGSARLAPNGRSLFLPGST